MAVQPEHRVSNKKKQHEDWYNNAYDYFIGRSGESNDKSDIQTYLNAANGIVEKEVYEYVLSPLVAEQDVAASLPMEIRDVDFIAPIRERALSEYLKAPYQVQVTVNNPDIVLQRNAQLRKQITELYEDYVVSLMNQAGMETGQDTQAPPDMQKSITQFTEEIIDGRAIDGQHILNLINDDNDFDLQRLELFFDWWATEQFYTYRYIENGEFYRDRIPVEQAYPIDNGEAFVEDMEGFVWKRPITFEEAKSKYRNMLTGTDKDLMDLFANSNYTDGHLLISRDLLETTSPRHKGSVSTQAGSQVGFTNADMVIEHTIIFKTEVKKKILTYDNGKGDLLERRVDDDYVLNQQEGDIKIENEWIEEVWIGYQLGSDSVNIQVKPQPVLIQRYDSKFRCKLPVGGKKGLINGLYINPIPYRLISYLALYKIYTLKQEQLIAKFKGDIVAMPKSMLAADEIEAKQQYFYYTFDNTIIYDDTEISPQNVSYGFKVVGNPGLERMIVTINELRRSIKEEAWELANMNKERMGDISPRAGKGVTEQAIYRAQMAGNLMTFIFNKALEKDHVSDMQWSKVAYIDGKTGYYRSDSDEPVFFNIDGIRHLETEYGLFVKNSEVEQQKLQDYKELAFSASQNGEFDMASVAISSTNSREIKRAIDKHTEAKREFEQQNQQQQQQAAQQLQQEAQEHELNKIRLEGDMDIEKEIVKAQLQPEVGNADAIAEAKLALEERKQSYTEDNSREQNRIKEKQIDSAEVIAKVNKN